MTGTPLTPFASDDSDSTVTARYDFGAFLIVARDATLAGIALGFLIVSWAGLSLLVPPPPPTYDLGPPPAQAYEPIALRPGESVCLVRRAEVPLSDWNSCLYRYERLADPPSLSTAYSDGTWYAPIGVDQ